MYKSLFLIALGFISSTSLPAQKLSVVVNYVATDGTNNSNNIYYQPRQFLNWDDFKGKAVEGSDAAALTNAGFGIKMAFRRNESGSQLVMSVNCNFSKKDSWVKDGNKTTYILNHEQKHFDIAYIHTLLFMRNLRNASYTNSNYASVIEKIYNEAIEAMSKMQTEYDDETSHSRIPEKQALWDEKISQQLELAARNEAKNN